MDQSAAGPNQKRIALTSRSHRLSVWPEEDWSGITDPKTRRRLQNRLNQRARRLQNKTALDASGERRTKGPIGFSSNKPPESSAIVIASQINGQPLAAPTAIDVASLDEIENVHILESNSQTTKTKMARLEWIALQHYAMGSPRTDLLLHLISLNFTRALMENTRILGLRSEHLHDDAISSFNTTGPWQDNSLHTLPVYLQPTEIQRSIPHHPWLDLLPDAQMRDNLILAGDFEEETQLCLDMKGSGSVQTGRSGIIVWSDPWDPAGWEITEPFALSWGWVIRDCYDLARSTNRWRAKRNERPLFCMDGFKRELEFNSRMGK